MNNEITEMAKVFGVEESALQLFTDGVVRRIKEFGAERFVVSTQEEQMYIIDLAVKHYFATSTSYLQDILDNKNGEKESILKELGV